MTPEQTALAQALVKMEGWTWPIGMVGQGAGYDRLSYEDSTAPLHRSGRFVVTWPSGPIPGLPWVATIEDGERLRGEWCPEEEAIPDLTDPDTFRGAVARLAERLGARPEAIADGVSFACHDIGSEIFEWRLSVGAARCSPPGISYTMSRRFGLGTADRTEALAAAWAQVLAEVKP